MAGKYDLEKRLVRFTSLIAEFVRKIEKNSTGDYLGNQLMRASISAALNYAEAQGAESRRDFRHKIRLTLKELREVQMAIKIAEATNYQKRPQQALLLTKHHSWLPFSQPSPRK